MTKSYLGWPQYVPTNPWVKPTAYYYLLEGEKLISRRDEGEWVHIKASRGETSYHGLSVVVVHK